MSNSFRTAQKRKLDYAPKDLAKALRQLREVSDQYVDNHPDIGTPLNEIAAMCFNMYVLIQKINDSF